MKKLWIFGLSGLLLIGCATPSTIDSRRQEKAGAYYSLAPEMQALVDAGQIKVGMPMDAVYISWGAPSDIVEGENQQGRFTTWLYYGTYWQEYRYWSYREVPYPGGYYLQRYLDHDYDPRSFVRAELVFMNGVLNSWRTLPRPG